MRYLYILLSLILSPSLFFSSTTFAQADCTSAIYGCTIGSFTTNTSGSGLVNDLPSGNNVSNPSTNPGTAGNMGCLLGGELNPTWIILTVSSPGFLEFTLGSLGGNGLYDWALWPYYDAGSAQSISGNDACADIQNNLLPPVACNWNSWSDGFTGMVQQGNLPPGASQGNFEHSFWATPGEQFVLCFSNWSGLVGANVPILTGNDISGNNNSSNSAGITCDPTSVGNTVCLGDTATVTINPGGIPNPNYTFLNDAGDVISQNGSSFDILPTDTTVYLVLVTGGTLVDTVSITVNVVLPPTPNAGADFTVCNGDPGFLNGTPTSPSNNFQWTYTGPGNITFTPDDEDLNAGISATAPGTYVFTLSETNQYCPAGTDQVTVIFEDPDFTFQTTDVSCSGNLDGEVLVTSADAVQYSFDNGATWQNNSLGTGLAAGNHEVCIKTINDCVTCKTVTLNDGNLVQIHVSNDTIVCENGQAVLNAYTNSGSGFIYHWSHTSNPNSNQTVFPTDPGYYTVWGEDPIGCSTTLDSIFVDLYPPLTVTSTSSQTICPHDTTIINATASGGIGAPYNYVWTDGNGSIVGSSNEIAVSPDNSMIYTITVTDGCESTPASSISEVLFDNMPMALLSVFDGDLCTPATFKVYNSSNSDNIQSVNWSISDGQVFGNQDTIYVHLVQPGQYDVELSYTTTMGCQDSKVMQALLNVHAPPKVDFTYLPNPATIYNTEVKMQNGTIGGAEFSWYFEAGSPSYSEEKNPTIAFPFGEEGEYQVQLIATSEYGCIDSVTKIVKIYPEVLIYAPNAFTPDGDGFNETWRLYMEGVDIYNVTLEIFNRWGEKVWESHDLEASWDGTYANKGGIVPSGTYVWKLTAYDINNDDKYQWNGHISVIR